MQNSSSAAIPDVAASIAEGLSENCKMTAARDFGHGQGGAAEASPSRPIGTTAEPRRQRTKGPSPEGFHTKGRLARCFSGKDPPRIFTFIANRPSAENGTLGNFQQVLTQFQPVLRHCFHPAAHMHLKTDVFDIRANCFEANVHLDPDFLVDKAHRQQLKHLAFARRQVL